MPGHLYTNNTQIHKHILANLLWSIDDEVSSGVEGTLVQLCQVSVRHAVEEAVVGAQHNRDFA